MIFADRIGDENAAPPPRFVVWTAKTGVEWRLTRLGFRSTSGMQKKLRKLIEISGIFDEDWYAKERPDLANSRRPLIDCFVVDAICNNATPTPLFDPLWYFEKNPDVAESGWCAIYHYLVSGGREWRAPSPYFDMDRIYESFKTQIEGSVTGTLLEAFFSVPSMASGLQFFDHEFYGKTSEFESLSFNELFKHFVTVGIDQGLNPHRLIDLSLFALPEERRVAFRELFTGKGDAAVSRSVKPYIDQEFYKSQCSNIEESALIHFLRTWKYNNAWIHPLVDLSECKKECHASANSCDPLSTFILEPERLRWPNRFFDTVDYQKRHSDSIEVNETAIEHYMRLGHLEHFDPSYKFSQKYYLRRHGEKVRSGWPALAEYLHNGAKSRAAPLPAKPFFDVTSGLNCEQIAQLIRTMVRPVATEPCVTVIVPVYQNIEYTLRCVWSLFQAEDKTVFKTILVDDASPDNSGAQLRALLRGIEGVEVKVNDKNIGFLRSCNSAASNCDTEFVCFLNNDTVVLNGWLDELVATYKNNSNVGLVGSKLVYPNGLLQEAGGIIWRKGVSNFGRMDDPAAPEYQYQRDVDYISGASILLKTDDWQSVGGFSDEFAPAYYEDTDLAMKIRSVGKRVIYQPFSTVVHFEGISSGADLSTGTKRYQAINAEKFEKKWEVQLDGMGQAEDYSRPVFNRSDRGRILVVDAELPRPDRDSGSVTSFHMLRILTKLGYRVTFMPSELEYEGRYVKNLQRLGVEVVHGPYVSNGLDWISKEGCHFDLFILSRAPVADKFFDLIKKSFPETPIIFDTVDIHHLRLLRECELLGDSSLRGPALKMKSLEMQMIRRADLNIVVSEYEVKYLESEIGPFPSMVMPLIYEKYQMKSSFEDRSGVAFVGNFRHPPNLDAVRYLVREVWPRVLDKGLDIDLNIVGSYGPEELQELDGERVNIIGYVEDLEAYLEGIRLTVAPLRYGAGVKGKVGNSLRMGVPVVGTPMALEGMGLVDGEHVILARDATSIADGIVSLHEQKELWERLSLAGKSRAEAKFGEATAMQKFDRALSALLYGAFRED